VASLVYHHHLPQLTEVGVNSHPGQLAQVSVEEEHRHEQDRVTIPPQLMEEVTAKDQIQRARNATPTIVHPQSVKTRMVLVTEEQ